MVESTGLENRQGLMPFESSNLSLSAILGVAQPGSASGLGPEGREFESLHRDQFADVAQW